MEKLHQPGDIIANRYRIICPLGQGGFGTTYEAEDLSNYKQVAIKALSLNHMDDWKVLELFEREAKILANLNHPRIPNYFDYFYTDTAADRRFYLVQEMVSGQSLTDLVQQGWHASEVQVQRIAIQVLQILRYLHQMTPPVIHRDIKPQNLILDRNGSVFLVDFGSVQDVYRHTISRGNTFVGTYGYMPPEQFRGQASYGSDLYSLGATLLFLLTHRSPADLPQQRLKINFHSHVQISEQFAEWLDKILEPTMEDRFQSAQEALDVLQGEEVISGSLVLTRKQPNGSHIFLQKTKRCLVVDIPPSVLKGYQSSSIALMGMLFFVFPLFFGLFVFGIYNGIPGFFMPHMAIGLVLFLWATAVSIYLKIDQTTFQVQWKLLGLTIYQFQGRTADICKVEIDTQINSKGGKTITCAIWEGVRKHKFGSLVTVVEKEWLVEEITDFLRLARSHS